MVSPSPAQVAEAEAMWAAGCPAGEVANRLGLTTRQLQHLRDSGRVEMPTRPRGAGGGSARDYRDPTPGEIVTRCLQIKQGWSQIERLNRRSGGGGVLTDKLVAVSGPRYGRTFQTRGVEPVG